MQADQTRPHTRPVTVSDQMDPARAEALAAALGRPFHPDAPLPPFAHHIYFWDARPEAELGRDGHPARGGLIPDLGLPRRMWAGGRLEYHTPLLMGRPAHKTTALDSATRKQGRSGPLAFVTLRHDIHQDGRLCVTEFQDIVYREDPAPGAPKPTPPRPPDGGSHLCDRSFSPVTLFRYSALTFNGHRIHYDRDYRREVEGYPGLVVHGPLLAQHLMLLAADAAPLRHFRFRATAPLFDFETATFARDGAAMWVAGPDGRMCIEAEAG